jgi:hypothetical protein
MNESPASLMIRGAAPRALRRVLRVGGPSQGADLMVRVARERGLAVFAGLHEVPGCGDAQAGI